jgi:hypothetical protein
MAVWDAARRNRSGLAFPLVNLELARQPYCVHAHGALAQPNSMRRIVIAIGLGTLAAVVIALVVTEWFEVAIKRVVIGVIMFLGTLR